MYVPGEPTVWADNLDTFPHEVQLLHNDVVTRSKGGEQCYTFKVANGIGFNDFFPADKIYLDFEHAIHGNIFYVSPVCPSLMRLWELYQARDPLMHNSEIALLDPYHMNVNNVECEEGQEIIMDYLYQSMCVNYPKKDTFLVPYYET